VAGARGSLRASVALAAAALTFALAGCGGDERTQVRFVTERFLAGSERHDGNGACAELSDATRPRRTLDIGL
jgi:hypothetical protein